MFSSINKNYTISPDEASFDIVRILFSGEQHERVEEEEDEESFDRCHAAGAKAV